MGGTVTNRYVPAQTSSPSAGQTRQGENNGDCSVVSSINAIAATNSGWIQKHVGGGVNTTGGGAWTVDLYDKNKNAWTQEKVTPSDIAGGGFWGMGANPASGPENYGKIMEAAYAKLQGGYNNIDHGNTSLDPLEAFLGPGVTSNFDLDGALSSASSGGVATVATANGGNAFYVNSQTGQNDGGTQKAGDVLIQPDHAYAVVSLSGNTVTLDNPWNQGGSGGGLFTVTKDTYEQIFTSGAYTTGPLPTSLSTASHT